MATRLLCRFRVHLAEVLGVLLTQLLLDVGEADAGGLEGFVDNLLRARRGGRGRVERVMGAAGLIYGKNDQRGDRGGGDGGAGAREAAVWAARGLAGDGVGGRASMAAVKKRGEAAARGGDVLSMCSGGGSGAGRAR